MYVVRSKAFEQSFVMGKYVLMVRNIKIHHDNDALSITNKGWARDTISFSKSSKDRVVSKVTS